ncbi:digalactosyldiacylglycerol synthase 1, chloroplastic-like isoform X1 [Musa acuminata AAA Group]|uniref:digalactosyldiacylglycerol synthase 1, chloroplastic-like isoform X1 n=1 Tax=Musa acuminata AAA Group TaxID=214697 RepID=UPI0031E2BF83
MVRWKGVEEEEQGREWEPIRILKTGLKELERKSQSTSNELVEKLKSSLGSFVKERQESKEVPPLDLPELLAYFVKQSGPFFNQLGIRQDICDKIVEALCSRRKDQLMYHSLSAKDTSLPGNENSDELDLRIASVLESMTLVNKMVKPRVIGAFKMCRVEIPTFSSYESLVIRVEKWTSWTSY